MRSYMLRFILNVKKVMLSFPVYLYYIIRAQDTIDTLKAFFILSYIGKLDDAAVDIYKPTNNHHPSSTSIQALIKLGLFTNLDESRLCGSAIDFGIKALVQNDSIENPWLSHENVRLVYKLHKYTYSNDFNLMMLSDSKILTQANLNILIKYRIQLPGIDHRDHYGIIISFLAEHSLLTQARFNRIFQLQDAMSIAIALDRIPYTKPFPANANNVDALLYTNNPKVVAKKIGNSKFLSASEVRSYKYLDFRGMNENEASEHLIHWYAERDEIAKNSHLFFQAKCNEKSNVLQQLPDEILVKIVASSSAGNAIPQELIDLTSYKCFKRPGA